MQQYIHKENSVKKPFTDAKFKSFSSKVKITHFQAHQISTDLFTQADTSSSIYTSILFYAKYSFSRSVLSKKSFDHFRTISSDDDILLILL